MKRKPSTNAAAALVLLAGLHFGQGLAGADSITVPLFSGSGEFQQAGDGKGKIKCPGFGFTVEAGKPMMPMRVVPIAVPPDAENIKVRFDGPCEPVPGRFEIVPAGMVVPAGAATAAELAKAKADYERGHRETYESDDAYPAQGAAFLGTGGLRKYKVVRVCYTPWQYHPQSKRIFHTPRLNVTVSFDRGGRLPANLHPADDTGRSRAQSLIPNIDQAAEWYSAPLAAAGGTPVATAASDYRYVIMCTEATKAAVEILADWKRSIGYRVHVFTKEWLQANTGYPGYELQRQIRYYLRDNYQAWNTEFFLIVGDHDSIPMRVCESASDGAADRKPSGTDLYYAELSEMDSTSWDDDWDGRYGEWDDDTIDWLLELEVGRIPDNDPATVEAICEKIRAYELDNGTWKNRGVLLGPIIEFAHENNGPLLKCDSAYLMEEMLDDWSWSGWSIYKMYEQEGIDPSSFSSVFPLTQVTVRWALSDGTHALVNMAGHGNSFGIYRRVWGSDDGDGIPEESTGEVTLPPMFDRNDIPSLDDTHPGIYFFGGCDCGKYNVPLAVGKQVLENGAIVSIAASEVVDHTNPWLNEDYGTLFTLQYLWNKRLVSSGLGPGPALTTAKEEYATSFTMDGAGVQLLLSMNYFGDPAVSRTAVTQQVNLDYHRPVEWDYAIVPRASDDATSTWCPASAALPGSTKATYLSFALTNNGSATGYDVRSNLYVDDQFVKWASWGWVGAGVNATYPNIGPFTVAGGRHTVKVVYDPDNDLYESNEGDNVWQKQYVWSPYTLSENVPVSRPAPPDPGTGTYYNCDGFRASLGSGQYWCAVGILPSSANGNNDLRLHQASGGSTSGFDSYLEWSGNPGDYSDFCIANRRQTGTAGPYDFGVVRRSGSSGFDIQQSNSGSGLYRTTYNGPFTLGAYEVVGMHEVYLVPGQWRIIAKADSGDVNLGLSAYDDDRDYFSKADYLPGAYANSGGAGADEDLTVTITDSGYHGIAVWKSDSTGHGQSGSYYLGIFLDTDGDALPDVWEQQIIDAKPADGVVAPADVAPGGDFDGDGSSNWAEFVAQTNPADCRSCLAIVEVRWNTDSSLSLLWRCVAQMVYRIEYCNDPGGGNVWRTAQNAIVTPATGMFEWKDDGTLTGGPPRLSPRRFYRVVPHGPGYP